MRTISEYRKSKADLAISLEWLCFCERPFLAGAKLQRFNLVEDAHRLSYECESCGHRDTVALIGKCDFCGQECVLENMRNKPAWRCTECGRILCSSDQEAWDFSPDVSQFIIS